MNKEEIKEYLDTLADKFNCQDFIEPDPISIPHRFERGEDIEISGFLASTIAWGNRKMIVRNASRMVELLDNAPYDFITNMEESDLLHLSDFVHRTFNGGDFIYFVRSISNIYRNHGGMKHFFESDFKEHGDLRITISRFYNLFFELEHEDRNRRHLSSIDKKGACKRLNMFLRWMVRKDKRGVDFGLWDIPMSALYLPLDIHTANVSRQLGILNRKQNDWKAVEDVTRSLREFNSNDPVIYDYALFGAGVSGLITK